MSVIFDQKPTSGAANLAKGEVVHEYQLIGVDGEFPDEDAASVYLRVNVPIFFSGAWLQDIQINPQGNGLYYVTCPYGPLPRWPGSAYRINFRTTGGTVHISASREQIANYDTGDPAADNDLVIIGQDGSGAEITVPTQMRSYSVNFPVGIVTESLMDYWETLTGVVNLNAWHNRPAGEVLFLGAEGNTTISADSNSDATFHFAMNRNVTNQTIGAIANIDKQGHDLIDIHTMTKVVNAIDVQVEKFIYIQRVYNRLDFLTFLGF